MSDQIEVTESNWWDTPEGRRQAQENSERAKKNSSKYYKKHGGTHPPEVRALISERTKEGIAKRKAQGLGRRRSAPKDQLWWLRVRQVMEEFDLTEQDADLQARQMMKTLGPVEFYAKYTGHELDSTGSIRRSLMANTTDGELIDLIMMVVKPEFKLPRVTIDRLVQETIAYEGKYPEELFRKRFLAEMEELASERKDYENVL